MGICHGWAPAAFSIERPENGFTVKAADGVTDIYFWPDDVRALASLHWAHSSY